MRITVLRAKEALRNFASPENLDRRLNGVCERFLTNGKFLGSVQRIVISAPYGQVTLPREFSAIIGIQVNGMGYNLGNQWYETLPGDYNAGQFNAGGLHDLGDGHAILYTPRITATTYDPNVPLNDIPTGGTITVAYAGGDPSTLTIYGYDADGLPVQLTFSTASTVSNVFARISRIHKEVGNSSVRVTFTTSDAVATLIALMAPTEEETDYRRYMIGGFGEYPSSSIVARVKRRHIPFASDQDVLPIGNIGALENGMQALQYEAENDMILANQYWQTGIDILNGELRQSKSPAETPPFRVRWIGGAPNLTSRY